MKNNIEELKLSYNNLVNQAKKNKSDADNHAANLSNEVAKGKELTNKLNEVNASIRAQEA